MPFRNYSITKGGALTIGSIHSPGFTQTPLSGWSIDKDGNAYFESVTIGGGVVRVTFASSAPSSPNTGDVWFNLSAGAQPNVWNGSAWVTYQWGTSAIAPGSITGALLAGTVTARSLGGITTTISGTAPAGAVAGDIWIDSANGYQLQQYGLSGWVPITFTATDVIAAGTITASQIAAGTITASQIAAGTITTSLIAANAITAGLIDAGAIDGMVINGVTINGSLFNATSGGMFLYQPGGTVLNANPDFTSGITDWTAGAGSISYTTPTYSSHDTMAIAVSTAGMPSYTGSATSESESVSAGSSYFCTFILQVSGLGSGYTSVAVNWYNSGASLIGQSSVASPAGNIAAWTTYTGIVTAPAGATAMRLLILGDSGSGGSGGIVSVAQASIASQPMLIGSLSPVSGTDSYGDTFTDGFASYGPSGGIAHLAANQSSGVPYLLMTPTGASHVDVAPQVYSFATNGSTSTEFYTLKLTSGYPFGDTTDAVILLNSANDNASGTANGALAIGSTTVLGWTSSVIVADKPVIADASWTNLSLATGFSAGTSTPQVRLMPDGTALLRGQVEATASESSGATMATLPSSAYYPTSTGSFATPNSITGYSAPNATVAITSGSSALTLGIGVSSTNRIQLDGIRWPVI